MNNKTDLLGYVFMTVVVLFCGLGFYWILATRQEPLVEKIALSAVWLIFSFMLIVYSGGINKGEVKTAIKVPVKPALYVFVLAAIMLLIALVMNEGGITG